MGLSVLESSVRYTRNSCDYSAPRPDGEGIKTNAGTTDLYHTVDEFGHS